MFDKAVITRPLTSAEKFDLGALAEAILFYQETHLVLDPRALRHLLRAIGSDNLLTLVREDFVKATLICDNIVVANSNAGLPTYQFRGMTNAPKNLKKNPSREEIAIATIEQALGDDPNASKVAKAVLEKVPVKRADDFASHRGGLVGLIEQELSDKAFVAVAARAAVTARVPDYVFPDDAGFTVHEFAPHKFTLATNFDFDKINKEYHRLAPSSTITRGLILASFADARHDLAVATEYMGEMVSDPWTATIMQARFKEMLKRRLKSNAEIEAFQEAVFGDGKAIREAINDGTQDFGEFLRLLDKARTFRQWLGKGHPDVGLMGEYLRSVTSEPWLSKFKQKVIRLLAFTGAGAGADAVLGTGGLIGVGLSAVDGLLVDKLAKGWNPTQFIYGDLKNFVGGRK